MGITSNILPVAVTSSEFDEFKRTIAIFSEVTGTVIVLYHHQTRRLMYVSKSYTDLTGLSQDDVDKLGRNVHEAIVHPKDYALLQEVHRHALDMIDNLLDNKPGSLFSATYNFRIKTISGEYQRVNCTLRPIYYSCDKLIKISLLILKPSLQKGIDRFYIHFVENNKRLFYYQGRNSFVSESKVQLKDIEIQILNLSAKGYNEEFIAKNLEISNNTVKFHKKNVFKKFHVRTIQEAVYIGLVQGYIVN